MKKRTFSLSLTLALCLALPVGADNYAQRSSKCIFTI